MMDAPKPGRPRPEDYRTRAEYRWARKLWLGKHGGSFIGTLALALIFGGLSGSHDRSVVARCARRRRHDHRQIPPVGNTPKVWVAKISGSTQETR